MKCPQCGGKAKIVWCSENSETIAVKCLKGHRVTRQAGICIVTETKHPVYLLEATPIDKQTSK